MDEIKDQQSSVLKIGNVISVEGRFIKVIVDKSKNASHLIFHGKTIKNVSVGSYIKICKGFEQIIGKIDGEFIDEDRSLRGKEYQKESDKIQRILKVSLLGYFDKAIFKRGIKELPLIDNECFLLDEEEFSRVHDFIAEDDEPIEIGVLALEKGKAISVGINSLFASHIGIFGNTGSGKSYTLTKMYHRLFEIFKDEPKFKANANFIFVDFNGEYVNQEDPDDDNVIVNMAYKNIYKLSTRDNKGDKYPISTTLIHDPIIWMIILEATEKTQTPFIRRALGNNFLEEIISDNQRIKNFLVHVIKSITTHKDKTLERGLVLNFLSDVASCTDGFSSNIPQASTKFDDTLMYNNKYNEFYFDLPTKPIYSSEDGFIAQITQIIDPIEFEVERAELVEKIHLKLVLNYYNEIVKGYSNKEHIAPLIKRLDRRIKDISKILTVNDNPSHDRNITIVSLRDVNIHMRKIFPLLLCKQLYEDKKGDGDRSKYLNIIIDEAHNILSSSSQRESEQWKDYRLETFEEIIKEGRKFGVFLTIASQRPYDISPTIISQLHNYLLHRLINNNDIQAIERTVSYLDKVSFDSLSILPQGTCVLAGLVAQVPVIIEIEKIEDRFKPFNQTIRPVEFWRDK